MSCEHSHLDPCGCCEGIGTARHSEPFNRPGLSELAYRIGRHSSFKASMLAAISKQESLRRLGTRRDDDFSIGLIDAWSVSLDVLAFYQERLANEAFLPTANQRRSLLELARLIGYRLGPGVAAEALLAFTLDDKEGSPETVTITTGTRAQSLPAGQDELPQSFETSEDLLAEARWNVLTPRLTAPQVFDAGTKSFYLQGVATGLSPGDPVLLVYVETAATDEAEEVTGQLFLRVKSVKADPENDRTLVVCLNGDDGLPTPESDLEAQLFEPELTEGEALAAMGSGSETEAVIEAGPGTEPEAVVAPPTVVDSVFGGPEAVPFETPSPLSGGGESPGAALGASAMVGLETSGNFFEATPQTEFGYQYMFEAETFGWTTNDLIESILAKRSVKYEEDKGLFALRVSSPPFGHNAPRYLTLPVDWTPEGEHGEDAAYPNDWDEGGGWPVNQRSMENNPTSIVYLARAHEEVLRGDWVVLTNLVGDAKVFGAQSADTASIADFSLSGEATRLVLDLPSGAAMDLDALAEGFKVRDTTIHTASEHLPFADLLVAEHQEVMPAGKRALQVEQVVPNLEPGRRLILKGELVDEPGIWNCEELELAWVEQGQYTRLVFVDGVTSDYKLSSIEILANVVASTHGESRPDEVLGSGDGSVAHQSFMLGQSPLTHVSAATPSGGESTLAVAVDGLRWHERQSLYDAGPRDRVFVVRQLDDGTTELRFGDGERGARPPSGSENVVATYRVGIGSDGLVKAGQISLLATRPLGVKEVVNPLASAGAEDAETRDEARQNAPLTVLTLDRVVSLRDFEDFARAFGGIGKARADWVWNGSQRVVHLTVAAPDGAELSDTVLNNLQDALDAAREPSQQVVVNEREQLYFGVELRVKVDPDHDFETVVAEITSVLEEAYSFTTRDFAQRVADSEVIALVQNVTGVTAVDLDALTELTVGIARDDFGLPARPARFDESSSTVLPAQLLTLAPATAEPVAIVEMT